MDHRPTLPFVMDPTTTTNANSSTSIHVLSEDTTMNSLTSADATALTAPPPPHLALSIPTVRRVSPDAPARPSSSKEPHYKNTDNKNDMNNNNSRSGSSIRQQRAATYKNVIASSDSVELRAWELQRGEVENATVAGNDDNTTSTTTTATTTTDHPNNNDNDNNNNSNKNKESETDSQNQNILDISSASDTSQKQRIRPRGTYGRGGAAGGNLPAGPAPVARAERAHTAQPISTTSDSRTPLPPMVPATITTTTTTGSATHRASHAATTNHLNANSNWNTSLRSSSTVGDAASASINSSLLSTYSTGTGVFYADVMNASIHASVTPPLLQQQAQRFSIAAVQRIDSTPDLLSGENIVGGGDDGGAATAATGANTSTTQAQRQRGRSVLFADELPHSSVVGDARVDNNNNNRYQSVSARANASSHHDDRYGASAAATLPTTLPTQTASPNYSTSNSNANDTSNSNNSGKSVFVNAEEKETRNSASNRNVSFPSAAAVAAAATAMTVTTTTPTTFAGSTVVAPTYTIVPPSKPPTATTTTSAAPATTSPTVTFTNTTSTATTSPPAASLHVAAKHTRRGLLSTLTQPFTAASSPPSSSSGKKNKKKKKLMSQQQEQQQEERGEPGQLLPTTHYTGFLHHPDGHQHQQQQQQGDNNHSSSTNNSAFVTPGESDLGQNLLGKPPLGNIQSPPPPSPLAPSRRPPPPPPRANLNANTSTHHSASGSVAGAGATNTSVDTPAFLNFSLYSRDGYNSAHHRPSYPRRRHSSSSAGGGGGGAAGGGAVYDSVDSSKYNKSNPLAADARFSLTNNASKYAASGDALWRHRSNTTASTTLPPTSSGLPVRHQEMDNRDRPAHSSSAFNKQQKKFLFKQQGGWFQVDLKPMALLNLVFMVVLVGVLIIVPMNSVALLSTREAVTTITKPLATSMANAVEAHIAFLLITVKDLAVVWAHAETNATATPTVMRQLCQVITKGGSASHLLYLSFSSPLSGFGAYCSQQYPDNISAFDVSTTSYSLVGSYTTHNESSYRYYIDPESYTYAEPLTVYTPVKDMTEYEYTVSFGAGHNPWSGVVLPWNATQNSSESGGYFMFEHNNLSVITYSYPFIDANGNLATLTGALQMSSSTTLQNVLPDGTIGTYGHVLILDPRTGIIFLSSWQDSDAVALDVWNTSTAEGAALNNGQTPQNVGDLEETDTFMAQALKVLGGLRGLQARPNQLQYWAANFNENKTAEAVVHALRIALPTNSSSSCDLLLLYAVQKHAFTHPIKVAREVVLGAATILLIVLVVIDAMFISIFLRPLRHLAQGLRDAAMLRERPYEVVPRFSVVREVADMQYHFAVMQGQLQKMKGFLPQGVLNVWSGTEENSGSGGEGGPLFDDSRQMTGGGDSTIITSGGGGNGMAAAVPSPRHHLRNGNQRNLSIDTLDGEGSTGDRGGGVAPGETGGTTVVPVDSPSRHAATKDEMRYYLNDGVLTDAVNTFRRRYCTVLFVVLHVEEEDLCVGRLEPLVRTFMNLAIPSILRYGGVIEVQRPDFLLVSFGAHSRIAMQQTRAATCALEIVANARSDPYFTLQLARARGQSFSAGNNSSTTSHRQQHAAAPEVETTLFGPRIGCLLDVGECFVGTCGAAHRHARVSYGMRLPIQAELLKLFLSLQSPVLLTQRIASTLEEHMITVPIDSILCTLSQHKTVLYELRGSTRALPSAAAEREVRQVVRGLRLGFHRMLRGEYGTALKYLSEFEEKDWQARRLGQLCRMLLARTSNKPFVRSIGRIKYTVPPHLYMVEGPPVVVVDGETGGCSTENSSLLPHHQRRGEAGNHSTSVASHTTKDDKENSFSVQADAEGGQRLAQKQEQEDDVVKGSKDAPQTLPRYFFKASPTVSIDGPMLQSLMTGGGGGGGAARESFLTEEHRKQQQQQEKEQQGQPEEQDQVEGDSTDADVNVSAEDEDDSAALFEMFLDPAENNNDYVNTDALLDGAVSTSEVSTVSGASAGLRSLQEYALQQQQQQDEDGHASSLAAMSSGAPREIEGELPFTFKDLDGNLWVRSSHELGRGGFATVYRGLSATGNLVALKCFPLRSRHVDISGVVEELRLLSHFHHENIVQYVSVYVSQYYLIEVMELVPGGSLDSLLTNFGRLTAAAVRRYLQDILLGLQYLHHMHLVHCDVKPHNVLLAMDGQCKLSDFGSALGHVTTTEEGESSASTGSNKNSITAPTTTTTTTPTAAAAAAALYDGEFVELRGTPAYMAPEVARGETPTAKSDVFSLGITLLELLFGRLPWVYAPGCGPASAAAASSSVSMSTRVGGSAGIAYAGDAPLPPLHPNHNHHHHHPTSDTSTRSLSCDANPTFGPIGLNSWTTTTGPLNGNASRTGLLTATRLPTPTLTPDGETTLHFPLPVSHAQASPPAPTLLPLQLPPLRIPQQQEQQLQQRPMSGLNASDVFTPYQPHNRQSWTAVFPLKSDDSNNNLYLGSKTKEEEAGEDDGENFVDRFKGKRGTLAMDSTTGTGSGSSTLITPRPPSQGQPPQSVPANHNGSNMGALPSFSTIKQQQQHLLQQQQAQHHLPLEKLLSNSTELIIAIGKGIVVPFITLETTATDKNEEGEEGKTKEEEEDTIPPTPLSAAAAAVTASERKAIVDSFFNDVPLADDVKDFLRQCVHCDPAQRPSVKQLLSHPWMM